MSENEAREELSGARQQSEEISGERRTNELVVRRSSETSSVCRFASFSLI
jgi:hypothetical protein